MPRDPRALVIGGTRVASDAPLFVIAEIALAHGDSLEHALELVDAAAAAGASAVKLQTIDASRVGASTAGPMLAIARVHSADLVARFELDEGAHREVAARARSRGLAFIATPCSLPAVEMLERVGVDAFKLGSGDLVWDQIVARCAASGRPVILSTGMASLDEVRHAVAIAGEAGGPQLALLHCVSAYPVPRGSENLRAIRTLVEATDLPVGLSDHAEDAFAVPMAVALGAVMYERHLVLDDDAESSDHVVSSGPQEFEMIVADARRACAALGDGDKVCLPAEAIHRHVGRRSLCAVRDLEPGDRLSSIDVVALRPAAGLPPASLPDLVGRRLTRFVAQGRPFRQADFADRDAPMPMEAQ